MFIQVVQDIVCPWCRIGKHNLDLALGEWTEKGNAPVDVQWFPYQLDPIEPHANENFRERFVERKGLQPDQISSMFERVTQAGSAAGLEFRFDRIELAQNTVLAHQLIALTPIDRQSAVIDALHESYFVRGGNIEDIAVLVDVARATGFDEASLPQLGDDLLHEVRRDDVMAMIGQAQAAGITGVPFFIFDGQLSLSGAHPPEAIVRAMEQAASQQALQHVD